MSEEKKKSKFWEITKKVLLFVPTILLGVLAFLFFRKQDAVDIVNPNDIATVDKDEATTNTLPETEELDRITTDIEDSMK